MSPKVSIVVPVYNIENYLENCLKSIVAQTYSNTEVILVNDGSTDNSLMICNDFVKKYDFKLVNKANGGLSSARNAGIDVATGKYITFIDGDDWIDKDYIEILINGILAYQTDISVVRMKKEVNPYIYESNHVKDIKWRKYDSLSALKQLFIDNSIGYSACNKLYSISLFNNVRYPEGMLMEDKATTYKILDRAERGVLVSNIAKYHYYMRPDGIMKRKFNPKRFDSFVVHNQIIEYMQEKHPQLLPLIKKRYVDVSIRMMMSMIEGSYHQRKEYDSCIEIILKYQRYVYQSSSSFLYKFLVKIIVIFKSVPWLLSYFPPVRFLFKKMELR